MSQDFQLQNDDIDEDEYMDDDFEEVSPRPKQEGHPASQSIQLDDNSNLAMQPSQSSNNNNGRTSQAAAAAIAVSPQQQVQQEPMRQGVIGNLEYGMRSSSPIRSRGTTPKARAQQQANNHSRGNDRQQHGSQNKSSNADLSEVVSKQNRKRRPPRNQDSQLSMAADDRSQMTANSGTKQSNASRNQHQQRASQSRMEEGSVLEQQPSIFNKKSQSSQNYTTPSQAHTSVNTRNLRDSDKTNLNLKAATISTLPDVATKDSRMSQKNNTQSSAAADQDEYNSGLTNIILPAKLKGGKQVVVKNNDASLNTSLTHIEGSDPGTLLREQEQQQQLMQHHASMAQQQSKTTTMLVDQQAAAAQKLHVNQTTAKNNAKKLQKQNYIKAPYQLMSQSVKTSVDQHHTEDLRNRAQPKSTKNASAQEMPHIYIHQNKMRGNGGIQGGGTGNQTTSKGMNNMHATFSEQQQTQQQQLPSARKQINSKHQNVGQPYRIRTKLPFYDSRGVYQGGRIPVVGQSSNNTGGGGASQHNANIQRKIQQFETAYNTVQQPIHQQNNKKARSIGQTSLLPNPHQSILPADLSTDQNALGPRESFEDSNKHAKNMTTIQPSIMNDEFSETIQEYQTSGDPRVLNSLIVRRGVSEYSGGSRGGAVRPPSLNNFKLKINNDLRSSVESVQANSAISQMARQKRGAFQTNYKIVQEVPFVESVNNYNQLSQNRRSRRKILAQSNNNASKANLNPEGLQEQANQASRASLLSSVAECGKHAERIQNLDSAVEQMKEELRTKDRLISKLLDNDDSPDDVNRKMAMQTNDEMRQTHKASLVVKLKSELDLAYKILSQRDTEINAMKRQAKQQAFKECNEERVLYMNECMKLQSLLKIYGGSNLRKQFKGVKVTQENVTRNSVTKSGEKISKISSRSRSPSALQAKDKGSSRKPLTSDVQAKMHLSGAFPENSKDMHLQEEPSFIDELQRKVKELLEINENLTQGLLGKDEELEETQGQIEQMALNMRGLEQNLIEKADLAKSLQGLCDEHADQIKSLQSNISSLKTSKDDDIKKNNSEIEKQSSEIKKQSSEIDALKKQLSSNDQQAVLLEQIEKLKSEHESALYEKEMEVESMTEQLSGLKEQLADKSKSEQTDDQLKKLKAELESAMIEIDSLKLKVVKAEQKNDELVKNQTQEEDPELAKKLKDAESLSEALQLKVKHSVQEIEHLKDKLESLEQQLSTERTESDEKAARIRDLENQLDELKETQRRDEIIASKQKAKSQADDKQSATDQIGDLELQNAELEAEIETLKKQVQRLENDLSGQQSGKVVIQNLEDKKNFANLISTQGNLLENLEIAETKNRALEEKVLEHEKSVSILSARRVDAQTQTEKEQVGAEVNNDYQEDFNNQSQVFSEIHKTDTGNNVSRTEKMQLSAQVEQLESQQIQDSEVECDENETLPSVQKEIKDALENYDRMTYRALRGKERALLKAELAKVQQALVKKNELINSTIESQERLAENSVMLKERLDKNQAELEESQVQLKHSASELQQKNDKLLDMVTKQNKLIEEKQASDKLSKARLGGLKDIARIILQEQFTAYRVTDQNRLQGMLEYDPQRVLEGQFLLPESAQQLIDCSAQGLFNLMDSRILPEVTETELEIGFRKLKEIFDAKNIDYKTFIFELDSIDNDDDKDADEIRIAVSKDTKMALPLMREEFIERVSTEDVLNDEALSQKIAIGCQQIARSVCFVHYWAFNCLWMQFNGKREDGQKKLTMKQLLEQVAADKALKEEMIADLQKQKQDEAERAQREKEEAQAEAFAEAERHKIEMEQAQRQREADLAEQARLREEELTEAARLKEEEAKKREEEIAEQARLRENELAEAARVREEEAKKREEELAEQARLKDEQAQKREQDLAEAARRKELEMVEAAKQKELEMTEAVKQRDLEAKKREEELAETAQRREEQLLEAARQNEELIRQQQNNSQQDTTDGQDGDREGFSVQIYKHIKQDADLGVIVSIANASLYSLRNQINVFNVDSRKLIDGHTNADIEEPPFSSLTEEKDEQNRIQLDPDNKEVEVIYHDDFFKLVLADMGLKKYLEIPEESEKLNQCLEKIGATCSDSQSQRKLIRLEVLMAAMRIHKYEYSGLNLATKLQNVDFRILNPRSMRIMNRLTRVVAQYQDKYQQKAKEGVKIQIHQIVNAIFKNQVEVRSIDRNLLSLSPVIEQPTQEGAITISQMDSSPKAQVQVLPKIKFYQTLNKLKVKKGESESANLSRFLRINGIQNDVFGFKKLVKVIEEFLRNHYLKSFSYNKKRLGALTQRNGIHGAEYGVEEEEEYYYDEEVPAAENAANQNESQKKQAPPFVQSNPESMQQQLQMIQTTQQQQQQALQPTPEYGDEEEYYYDEEVPAGEEEAQGQNNQEAAPAYQMRTHQDLSQPIQDDETNPLRNIRLDKPINHRFVAENRSLEIAPNTHANSTRMLGREPNQNLNLTSQNSMHEFKAFNSQIGHYPGHTGHQSIDGGVGVSEGYRGEPEASSKYPGSISGADPSLMGKGDDDDFF